MLSHYMIDKGVHMTDEEDKGQATLISFMQKHKNVTRYRCGKKGHCTTNKCPNEDSNEKSPTRSSLSNRSNNSRPTALNGAASMMVSRLEARSMIPQECVG
jgi:hypothetical protein